MFTIAWAFGWRKVDGRYHGVLRGGCVSNFKWIFLTMNAYAPAVIPSKSDAAEATFTSAIVSDYDYRGVSQTANEPALQMAADYTRGSVHVQAWTSNVDFDRSHGFFGPRHTEIAFSADVRGQMSKALSYDAGINYYEYPGVAPSQSYPELFVCLAHRLIDATVHYTSDYDNERHGVAYYFELNSAIPLHGTRLRALAHWGESTGEFWTRTNGRGYTDYSIGLSGAVGKFEVALHYIGTSGYSNVSINTPLSGTPRWVLSLSTAIYRGS